MEKLLEIALVKFLPWAVPMASKREAREARAGKRVQRSTTREKTEKGVIFIGVQA